MASGLIDTMRQTAQHDTGELKDVHGLYRRLLLRNCLSGLICNARDEVCIWTLR
jgi:hypothetical protein